MTVRHSKNIKESVCIMEIDKVKEAYRMATDAAVLAQDIANLPEIFEAQKVLLSALSNPDVKTDVNRAQIMAGVELIVDGLSHTDEFTGRITATKNDILATLTADRDYLGRIKYRNEIGKNQKIIADKTYNDAFNRSSTPIFGFIERDIKTVASRKYHHEPDTHELEMDELNSVEPHLRQIGAEPIPENWEFSLLIKTRLNPRINNAFFMLEDLTNANLCFLEERMSQAGEFANGKIPEDLAYDATLWRCARTVSSLPITHEHFNRQFFRRVWNAAATEIADGIKSHIENLEKEGTILPMPPRSLLSRVPYFN
jgi:hypothetical protein